MRLLCGGEGLASPRLASAKWMIAVAAFIGLMGCGAEGALEVRAPIRSQSQSIAPQSPLGVVESFSAPRPVGPGVAKLLETAAKAATVPLAPTALVSERGTRELLMLRRSSLATRSPALVELMAFLAGSTHPEGDAKLQTAIVPTKTIREEFRDGKLYRIAEYTYRGRLITRVQLGTASIGPTTLLNHTHLPPATSFLPTTLLSASTSATSSASGYDFYAEDDSLSIDEVADQVALIDALREEVDLGLWEVEDAYEEWYGHSRWTTRYSMTLHARANSQSSARRPTMYCSGVKEVVKQYCRQTSIASAKHRSPS
jgi:hypothetical protein